MCASLGQQFHESFLYILDTPYGKREYTLFTNIFYIDKMFVFKIVSF